MTDEQQRAAAKHFSEHWKNKGYEKGESQPFWLSLLRDVYGIEHPEEFILKSKFIWITQALLMELSRKPVY